jgi:hypothetical protein
VRYLFWTAVAVMIVGCLQAQQSNYVPDFTLAFGTPITFATHTELAGSGFSFGPSDGAFGGIPAGVGYGSLLVADANGAHLDNPPSDPSHAYFYLLFDDFLPGLPGVCNSNDCIGIARAAYDDVVTVALSGDAHQVAQLFHKYDGASPNPWTQPATAFLQGSATPDLSATAGRYAPLWSDETAHEPVVIYDRSFDVYLAVYPFSNSPRLRASKDLIHWSAPFHATYTETGNSLIYPTLVGETGDPTIGGLAPRVYFSSFPVGKFPDYTTATFESLQLILTPIPRHRAAKH